MVLVKLLDRDLSSGVEERGLCRCRVLELFYRRSSMINIDGRQVESVLGCGV